MAKRNKLVAQAQTLSPEVRQLHALVGRIDKDNPAPADVQALRRHFQQHPELWREVANLAHGAGLSLLRMLLPAPHDQATLKAGLQAQKLELGYEWANPLVRSLIDQVVLAGLHLSLIQNQYNDVFTKPMTQADLKAWDGRLSAAQQRYIRAMDAYVRIREKTSGWYFHDRPEPRFRSRPAPPPSDPTPSPAPMSASSKLAAQKLKEVLSLALDLKQESAGHPPALPGLCPPDLNFKPDHDPPTGEATNESGD